MTIPRTFLVKLNASATLPSKSKVLPSTSMVIPRTSVLILGASW